MGSADPNKRMAQQSIGFIGAGQMATALAQGFVRAGLVQPERLMASDPVPQARARFAQATGGQAGSDNLLVISQADVIFLAVKPQHMAGLWGELRGRLGPDRLVVSIAAGIRLNALQEGLGEDVRLIRVMPNTPCLVNRGACAYCLGVRARAEDGEVAKRLLESVGIAWQVDEGVMDAATGLSGSGPAFVYVLIEALSDGGVRVGLPRTVATALAVQTVLGAAEMVSASGEHPAILKDRVASPGGTTIAGLQALENGGFRAAAMAAVQAAAQRSAELGAR